MDWKKTLPALRRHHSVENITCVHTAGGAIVQQQNTAVSGGTTKSKRVNAVGHDLSDYTRGR